MTRNGYGCGAAYYVATWPGAAGLTWLVDKVCDEAGALNAPSGMEVVRRERPEGNLTYLLNHTSALVVELPTPLGERLAGGVHQQFTLAPLGVAMLEDGASAV